MSSISKSYYNIRRSKMKSLNIPMSIMQSALPMTAKAVLTVFRFRAKLSRANHKINYGTRNDKYFDRAGGFVFIKFTLTELLDLFHGVGIHAIRDAINLLVDHHFVIKHQPKHSFRRVTEYEITQKPIQNASLQNGHIENHKSVACNYNINNTGNRNNTKPSVDRVSVDTQKSTESNRSSYYKPTENDKKLAIVKAEIKLHKPQQQINKLKAEQGKRYSQALRDGAIKRTNLKKLFDQVYKYSFGNYKDFEYYTGMIFNAHRDAYKSLRYKKGMDQLDFRYLSKGLSFEQNIIAYEDHDFIHEAINTIIVGMKADSSKFKKTSRTGYIIGGIKGLFIKAAEKYNYDHNPVLVKEREIKAANDPKIPIFRINQTNDTVNHPKHREKLHPTSKKLQNKIKRQLKELNYQK